MCAAISGFVKSQQVGNRREVPGGEHKRARGESDVWVVRFACLKIRRGMFLPRCRKLNKSSGGVTLLETWLRLTPECLHVVKPSQSPSPAFARLLTINRPEADVIALLSPITFCLLIFFFSPVFPSFLLQRMSLAPQEMVRYTHLFFPPPSVSVYKNVHCERKNKIAARHLQWKEI